MTRPSATGPGGEVEPRNTAQRETDRGGQIFLVEWFRPHWLRAHGDFNNRRYYVRRAAAGRLVALLEESGAVVRFRVADHGPWSEVVR